MSMIKDASGKLMLNGKEVKLLFSLNALDEVQDKFDGYENIAEKMNPEHCKEWVKNIRWLLTLLINEGLDEDAEQLTEKQVGRLVNTNNMQEITSAILLTFANGTSGDNVATEQEEPAGDEGNTTGAQDA